MRIIGFITERRAIDKILAERRGIDKMLACMELVEENSQSPPLEEAAPVELTYEPCYDDLPVGEIV